MLANAFQQISYSEFSVSEISNKIKYLLQENLGTVRVKGEITGLKFASSGHVYFNLKDNMSVLSCVCWQRSLPSLTLTLSEESNGLEVAVIGKISSFGGQSKYQLIVDKIEPAGIGAMMQILNERKAKLAKEGLFDAARKKTFPTAPRLIAIITSLEGAVIRDIIHRITDRYPTNVIIWPATVQGAFAAEQVTAGIVEINKLSGTRRPEVIIVARGGGSAEDLWAFNEEILLRAVAASQIAIISAIGHANDYTLIDEVADIAAPTPTAAAEIVTPVKTQLIEKINFYNQQLKRNINEIIKFHHQIIFHNSKILDRFINNINNYQQKIDELSFRFNDCLSNLLRLKQTMLQRYPKARLYPYNVNNYQQKVHELGLRLFDCLPNLLRLKQTMLQRYPKARLYPYNINNYQQKVRESNARLLECLPTLIKFKQNLLARFPSQRLYSPKIIQYQALQLNTFMKELDNVIHKILIEYKTNLTLRSTLLQSLDYRSVLKRGFSLVTNLEGKFITSSNIPKNEISNSLNIKFFDGEIEVQPVIKNKPT